MSNHISSSLRTNTKDTFLASVILITIIILITFLAWMFNPLSLIFSEDFENTERNQQYMPCPAFTIEQGRLRVTVASSYSGCAVRLPNEYDQITFTGSVYPVQEVHDGTINLLFGQSDNGGYEIQFRPNYQQVNFIETAKNDNQEMYIKFTTGWIQTPSFIFNDSENKIKLTFTKHTVDFWFNDVLIFSKTSSAEFSVDQGIIKVGAGAGEIGGIAFEFDNIEIYTAR